jgi:hypothetical protein
VRRRLLRLGLGAALAAGCTPLGLARGDLWEGTSTGDLGACAPFEFHLVIDEGRISGSATAEYEWGMALWELRGLVGPERRVTLETKTDDPRVTQPSLTWTGTVNPIYWELTHGPDPDCPTPRTVKFQRR